VTFLVIANVIRKRIPAIATKITIIKRGGMVRRTRVIKDRDIAEMETLTEDQNLKNITIVDETRNTVK
jgi:hypothetical protein